MKRTTKKIAKLTRAENKAWEHAFSHYVDIGLKDSRADERAWKDVCFEFPRLRKYRGCK